MDYKSSNDATDEHKDDILVEYPNDEEASSQIETDRIAEIEFNVLCHPI